MSVGKQEESQGTLYLSYDQLPKSMGHAFYDHLQRILLKGGFDRFAEELCEPTMPKAATPETCGQAAVYFGPLDVEDMDARILALIESPELADEMRVRGCARAREFRWDNTGRATARLLAEFL